MRSFLAARFWSCRFIFTFCFTLFIITGCSSNDIWLNCVESRGWESPEDKKKFYLNFKSSNKHTTGLYIDDLNNSTLAVREYPNTITATASIYQYPGQKGFIQVIYKINRESLEFSKITRSFANNRAENNDDIGGISISKAGSCEKIEKPINRI